MNRSLTLFALGASLISCTRGDSLSVDFRHNKNGKGTPVARFGKDSITAEELQQRLAEMSPYARARYQTLEQKKEYVDGVARFELLAAEALREGLQNDPDVIETAKKVMVQKLIQNQSEAQATPASETDLADYYQRHLADYVKPEMIRLSDVFLAAPDAASREHRASEAAELLKQATALEPSDFAAFGKFAREHSEEPRTKPLDGDMRYLSAEEIKAQYGPELAEAATQLKSLGDVSPVISTPRGLHILKLQGRQNALNLPLADVKPQVQGRIAYERKTQSYEAFIERLKKESAYQIDDAALAHVEVDLKAPTAPPRGALPGYLPAPSTSQLRSTKTP